jgi:hypothetical protein
MFDEYGVQSECVDVGCVESNFLRRSFRRHDIVEVRIVGSVINLLLETPEKERLSIAIISFGNFTFGAPVEDRDPRKR